MSTNEISKNSTVKQLFRYIPEFKRVEIDNFYLDCLNRQYAKYTDVEMAIMNTGSDYINSDLDVFKNYSGYNFRHINNALRYRWNYEEDGHIEGKDKYDKIACEMKQAISNNPRSIGNTKTYRGVTIDYFKDYGVNSLSDLENLKGQFLLDRGFVSTSLVEDKCFFKKGNELGLNYNVKIEYLVPEEFTDGICISNVSYSPDQCEYLVNAFNLAKVIDVSVSSQSAVVKAVFIPKKVYDNYYSYSTGRVK